MSHDCVPDSGIQLIEVKNFLNSSADKFLVSIDRGPRFIGGIPFAFYLRQKLSYLRKHFVKDLSRAAILALAKSINYTW